MLPRGQFRLIVFFPGYETVFFGGEVIFVKSYPFYFILNFPFHIGVEPMNNIVIVSGGSAGTQPSIAMCPFSKLPSHPGYHVTLSRVPCPTCTFSLIFDGSNILPIFNSVTHFLLLRFKYSSYILNNSPFSDMFLANIFSESVACFLVPLTADCF